MMYDSRRFAHSKPLTVALGFFLSVACAQAQTFDEQRAAASRAIEAQPEAKILALLKAGIEEGKPTQAAAETRKWLRQNLPEDAMLLYYAGRAAELSGDASSAAALYQQYLKKADPKSETVSNAVIAVHSLLRDQLNDVGAAYSFNRSVGDRLAVNAISRQFDQWFLAEARKRQDVIAVANRLHANIKAGVSNDLIETFYLGHFRWLLAEVDGYLEQGRKIVVTDEVMTAYRKLTKAMSFSEEMALRLNWAVAVRAYHFARIAEKEATAPIEEAKALLSKYPYYAKWVQDGWAGGGNGQHYRNDSTKYWPHETEAKLAPIVAAASKLTPLQRAELLKTWETGYYGRKEIIPLQIKVVQDYVATDSNLTNSRNGLLVLTKPWNEHTPEEAQALAPKVIANASPTASLIRAVAAGGAEKDLNKMIAALLGPEAWRLGSSDLNGRVADQLWHYAGRPDGNGTRDQKIKESKAILEKIKAATLKKESAPNQRIGRFRQLWADYKSGQPKIPSVVGQLRAILLITPEALPELLKDQSVEAQFLARETIAAGISSNDPIWKELEAANKVNVKSYAPGIVYLAQRHAGGSIPELKKRQPQKSVFHPLEPEMKKLVESGLKQNKIQPWQVLAWINMQYSEENAEQIKLAQALVKSPAWKSMPFEVHFGMSEWFKKDVMTPGQIAMVDAADVTLVSSDLYALIDEEKEGAEGAPEGKKKKKNRRKPKPDGESDPEQAAEDIPAVVAALQSTIDGLRTSPVRLQIPEAAMENLVKLDPAVFADAKIQELLLELIDPLKALPVANTFGYKFVQTILNNSEPQLLHRTAPYIWQFMNRNHRLFPQVRELTQSQVDVSPSAASALASAGLDAFARHRGHSYFKRDSDVPLFKSIRGNAAMKMGLIVIPVPKNDPAFPVYQSQGDWITGNEESAWDLLNKNWDVFIPVHRELSMPYLMWVLQRVIYSRDENRQEELVKALMGWAGEDGSPLTPSEKAKIEIAYGDIAMQLGQLAQAHDIFARTQKSEAYQELPIRHVAALRRVRAQRIAKNFDEALKSISELELERIPEFWEEIRFARSLVYYDMEEYEDAKDDIESILARNSNQADAKILLGKVQLKRQKLMEATEVELGTASSQNQLVPGENLKVTLVDPTLAVSGAGTEIEVVVWATSGDKELFFLRQFGDSKTKFRGEVVTSLGEPKPGDDILQVIGDDEVYYAYSERFREKMNKLEEKRGGPIKIASDAILMASARKLLTEAEQRTADMQAVMDSIRGDATEGATKAAMAARMMSAEARAESEGFSAAEFDRFVTNVAKPGNPIHVRVVDPDRSRTAGTDELVVSVASSSGDSISSVTLKETGTHTGWFEGSIPTAGAQALAFARNSEPGRNPNMVISPQAETYPAWRPVASQGETPEFTIDLNDNVALDEMTIIAREPGAKLGTFILQTGMNPGAMRNVASYPRDQVTISKPWHPSVVVMNDTDQFHAQGDKRTVEDFRELVDHLEGGWTTQQFAQNFATNVSGLEEALPAEVMESVKWKRQNRHEFSSVIYRFKGHFYEEENVTRRFRLNLGNFSLPEKTHPSVSHPPKFFLAVNGRRITGEDGKLDGKMNLRAGVHSFEIWAVGWVNTIGFGERGMKLQVNLGEDDQLIDCPENFFNPETFPAESMEHRNAPAVITANENGTEFKVKFAAGSRARMLSLQFLKQEGPVPALNQLMLTGPDEQLILPVKEDFASLNKNKTLEILTGDKISVRYVDDRFVTKSKERLERSLDVAFTNARVEFADMKPRFDRGRGKDMPYYEKLLRFPYDEPLSLAIHDADMDVSVEPDKVKVTILNEAGEAKEFEAIETDDSTGVFELVIVPVKGSTSKGNQVKVAEGGTITAVYRDEENNRPGVPTERTTTIDHAAFAKPEIKLSHATVTPLQIETTRSLIHGFERRTFNDPDRERIANERISPSWLVENKMITSSAAPEGGIQMVHGRIAYIELVAPHLALGIASGATVYAQTESGRRTAGAGDTGFDITVPGTIAINATTGQTYNHGFPWRDVPQLEIYQGGGVSNSSKPEYDRFKLTVPLVADMPPLEGALDYDQRRQLAEDAKTSRRAAAAMDQLVRISGLVVKPGETIYFGFPYLDTNGEKQWTTASAKVVTHPAFDIMSEDYRDPMTSAYVGETLNLRVVDLGADTSDAADTVSVLVQAKESGEKHRVELRESGPHTGIFKAMPALSYSQGKKETPSPEGEEETPYNVRAQGFPVFYGDTVAARYTDSNGVKSGVKMVTISKGADGSIEPFSKIYEDVEIATRTQFSLAEAYLEMAKRLRKLDQPKEAALKYASAKQLLSKAIDEFTDPDTRAHAEYLLGTLTMEEADATEDPDTQETRYRAALSRFLSVTGSYPQTLHASKSQYQIATLYERLKEPDIAAQEYVKLAYKYPDSEYLATSMARLGSHFLKKAAAYEAKAKPLLEDLENKDAQFEGAALKKMAVREYIKTAQIFGRLQERFPSDSLAGQAGLRAGQAFMRADKEQEAIDSFERVINEQSYDGPKVRAQAMYWMGMCYQDIRQQMAAYSTFKRLTYDFPESRWAAFARAQLSQESLLKLETQLELERLESEE
ncbi:MAG: tetratricopeptide repeat protein [Akkermansiaceae bacterium]